MQIAQLETALKADLLDKNQILDRVKAEQGSEAEAERSEALLRSEEKLVFAEANEKLAREMKALRLDCLERRQQLEEANSRLKLRSRVSWPPASVQNQNQKPNENAANQRKPHRRGHAGGVT